MAAEMARMLLAQLDGTIKTRQEAMEMIKRLLNEWGADTAQE